MPSAPKVVADSNAAQFLKEAGELLYQNEPSNSLLLGLGEGVLAAATPPKNPPLLLRVVEDGHTRTAALQTPPNNLVLTFANEADLRLLAEYVLNKRISFPGVVGPAFEAETFAKIWAQLSGCVATLGMAQKIYKIEKVILPSVAGELRLAQSNNLELIAQWCFEFARESLPPFEHHSLDVWRSATANKIEKQQVFVWLVQGQPVSMAHAARPTRNGVSIRGVYTPPAFRKSGFASAVVAHLSHKMLAGGKKFCVLYTDLLNPTSNKIYQNIGYKEVSDSKHFQFSSLHA